MGSEFRACEVIICFSALCSAWLVFGMMTFDFFSWLCHKLTRKNRK